MYIPIYIYIYVYKYICIYVSYGSTWTPRVRTAGNFRFSTVQSTAEELAEATQDCPEVDEAGGLSRGP